MIITAVVSQQQTVVVPESPPGVVQPATVNQLDLPDTVTPAVSGTPLVANLSAGPGSSSTVVTQSLADKAIDDLIFEGRYTREQISVVVDLVGNKKERALHYLHSGISQAALLRHTSRRFKGKKPQKVFVDGNNKFADMFGFYKSCSVDFSRPIKIILDDSPAIDIGGVRRAVFSEVFSSCADNQCVRMFDGPPHFLRPRYSIEIQSTMLMKVLGQMIAHSIAMDGVGFPYLSPTCFWYLIGGVDKAPPFLGESYVSDVVNLIVKKVCTDLFTCILH